MGKCGFWITSHIRYRGISLYLASLACIHSASSQLVPYDKGMAYNIPTILPIGKP